MGTVKAIVGRRWWGRGGQPAHVGGIAGQDDPAPGLDSGGNDVCIAQQRRTCARRGKDTSNDTGERAVRVSRGDAGLARQAGVDHVVVVRATVELGQYDRWDDYFTM